jgi:nitrite reductase/ring-hydroxylating ferredoxin subunit
MNSRRQFIKNSCGACLGLVGINFLLESCATPKNVVASEIINNTISVSKDKFLTSNVYLIRNKKLDFDILLVKNKTDFQALEMRCTHNDVALSFTGNKMVCNAHGSEFDLKGNVTKEPANKPLSKYKITETENSITIHI